MRSGTVARAWTGGDRTWGSRRLGRARSCRGDPPESEMSAAQPTPTGAKRRLVAVVLDEESIGRSNPDVEHERQVAIYDLIEQNIFAPDGHEDEGPFALHLSITGSRLVFDIRRDDGTPLIAHLFSLTPLRRIV